MDRPRDRRSITPVDPVQGTTPRSPHPPLHGGQAHPMRSGHRPQRDARSDFGYHRAPLCLPTPTGFLFIASPLVFFTKHTDREAVSPP
jgi:hypothetical protein